MLKDHPSSAIVAVADLDRACAFYSDTLGLALDSEGEGQEVLSYRTGDTRLIVYRSDEAGGNHGNAAVWGVGDEIESIVAGLTDKGVAFEEYPQIGEYRGGIHQVDGAKLVWLKDLDGNILHLNDM